MRHKGKVTSYELMSTITLRTCDVMGPSIYKSMQVLERGTREACAVLRVGITAMYIELLQEQNQLENFGLFNWFWLAIIPRSMALELIDEHKIGTPLSRVVT